MFVTFSLVTPIERPHSGVSNRPIHVDELLEWSEATSVDLGDALEDARWDALFAQSQDHLDHWADEILAKYNAGLTEEFDPDTDFDLQ